MLTGARRRLVTAQARGRIKARSRLAERYNKRSRAGKAKPSTRWKGIGPMLLREVLGETLRSHRLAQRLTLREVSAAAKVSLGYLSEVERGQKEASSELLAAICEALNMELGDLMRYVGDELATNKTRFTSSAVVSRRALRAVKDPGSQDKAA